MTSVGTRINVALIPDKRVASLARKESARLRKSGGVFALDASHEPHVTIYMTDYPRAVIKKIPSLLRASLEKGEPLTLSASRYLAKKDGYVEVRYRSTKAIQHFQQTIIETLNHLRGGVPANQNFVPFFSALELKNNTRYGYPTLGSHFHPHLTFTRFKGAPPKLSYSAPKQSFSFAAQELGVYLARQDGSCKKIIARIPLRTRR